MPYWARASPTLSMSKTWAGGSMGTMPRWKASVKACTSSGVCRRSPKTRIQVAAWTSSAPVKGITGSGSGGRSEKEPSSPSRGAKPITESSVEVGGRGSPADTGPGWGSG
jgi:hypothetical protein